VTPTYHFDAAADYSLVQLADLVTAAFHGYALPVNESAVRLARLIRMQGLDLANSVVIRCNSQPVGISFLGLRNTRAWISAFGIIPAHRGRGLGRALMDRLVEQARGAGAQDVRLEVLVGNLAARRVYTQSGFLKVRELVTLERSPWTTLPPRSGAVTVEQVEVQTAVRFAVELEQTPACWQREAPSLTTGSANGEIVKLGSRVIGCALHSTRDSAVALHHICAGPDHVAPVIGAVLAHLVGTATTAGRHVTLLNEPETLGLAEPLRAHGFRETIRQVELRLEL
jgi:ribosomal protein S18 acetylase RimI-like enzyme